MKTNAVLLSTFLLGGCASLQGLPTPVLEMTPTVNLVRASYGPATVLRAYAGQYCAGTSTGTPDPLKGERCIDTASKRDAYRDEVLFSYLAAIDARYSNFITGMTSERKYGNSLLSITGLYTAALASVTSGVTATGFATASAFAQGSQGKLNKDLFYEQTLPALINMMDAERAKVRTQILKRLADDRAGKVAYLLPEVLGDVARYEEAASVERAVAKLISQSALSLEKEEKKEDDAQNALSGTTTTQNNNGF